MDETKKCVIDYTKNDEGSEEEEGPLTEGPNEDSEDEMISELPPGE